MRQINKRLKHLSTCLFCLFLLSLVAPTAFGAKEIFMPMDMIKPDMNGEGYSVFSGTEIQKFNVRVLSIVEGNSEQDRLILVRLTGKPLTESGGLAAGMSGSPVFIDRKLVGAISYGFENADSFLALVTPIERMLKLFPDRESLIGETGLPRHALPIATPVLISGLNQRNFDLLSDSLAGHGLKAIFSPQFGDKDSLKKIPPLQPGSAIAVQMVSGDYQVSAIGTITWVDRNNFIAFGHSFTNKGNVDLAAFQAYIFYTVKSPVMSFKLGAPLKEIGRVVQDRKAGIFGTIGERPNFINVRVKVRDVERNIVRQSRFEVTNNEQLYRDLIISGVTDVIDQTIDRVGSGTANVNFRIETKEQKIIRDNLFYGKDIAVSCLKDLRNIIDALAGNEVGSFNIEQVDVEVEIRNSQVSARVVKIQPEKLNVKPGETINVDVIMRAYRGDTFKIPFTVKIPQSQEPGKMLLSVYGGVKNNTDGEEEDRKKEQLINYKEINTIADIVKQYQNAPKNNELVLEYSGSTAKKGAEANNVGLSLENGKKPEQLKYQTKYYVLGEDQINLEITQP